VISSPLNPDTGLRRSRDLMVKMGFPIRKSADQ
jgi:hypothetical protein